MIRMVCAGLLCALIGGWDGPASAQLQIVAGDPVVQDLLGLTPEEKARVNDLHLRYDRLEELKLLELSQGVAFDSLSTAQQNQLRPRFTHAVKQVDQQALEELARILSPEQIQRLRQLRIQALGPAGILAGKLNDPLQIQDEAIQALRDSATGFPADFSVNRLPDLKDLDRPEIDRIYKRELTQFLIQQLSQQQQARYRELVGEIVDLPRIKDIR